MPSDASRGDTLFAHTLPEGDRRARKVRGVPRPTLGHRLWFAWSLFWISLMTIPFSFIQMATHCFWPTARNFKRWAARWGGSILGGLGLRVEVEDRAHLADDAPCIFVVNHQNMLDILIVARALPHPFGFLAKKELTRVPFLGFAIRHSASLFIDRSDPRAAVKSLHAAADHIRAGNPVLFYAEGSRSYSPEVYPFKKGAFYVAVEAGVPLVPVTILDSYRIMDERSYAARPGTIRMVVGEPISMEGCTRRDLPEVMAAVRERMETELAEECRRAGV